ncbi:MAG: helix-turn-helix transcriptional regulator [Proteobacteria bacterium]|nr:helix-turn-helix transcriptional regulator [Pseudomonadota bacterium]
MAEAKTALRMRELRMAKGLTVHQLGALIGVTGAQVGRYETGRTVLSSLRAAAVAEVLGVDPEALYGIIPNPAPKRSRSDA